MGIIHIIQWCIIVSYARGGECYGVFKREARGDRGYLENCVSFLLLGVNQATRTSSDANTIPY